MFLWHSEGVNQEEELGEETVFKAEVANVGIFKRVMEKKMRMKLLVTLVWLLLR